MVISISLLNIITLNQKKQINKKENYCTRKARVISSINNRILGLVFNFLRTKISSHRFLNSLKYLYHLVK